MNDITVIFQLLRYCRLNEAPALIKYALLKLLHRPARIDLKLRGQCWTVDTAKPSGLHFFHEVHVNGCYTGIRRDIEAISKPLIIDGGANCGAFALWALSVNPGARVISFEPGEAFESLAVNREMYAHQHGANWEVKKCALSSRAGVGHFEQDAGSSQGHLKEEGGEEVPMQTIDGLGLPVQILKIDVEGHEMEVLRGSEKTLESTRTVVLEYHSPELRTQSIDFLAARGFELEGGTAPEVGMLIGRKRGPAEPVPA